MKNICNKYNIHNLLLEDIHLIVQKEDINPENIYQKFSWANNNIAGRAGLYQILKFYSFCKYYTAFVKNDIITMNMYSPENIIDKDLEWVYQNMLSKVHKNISKINYDTKKLDKNNILLSGTYNIDPNLNYFIEANYYRDEPPIWCTSLDTLSSISHFSNQNNRYLNDLKVKYMKCGPFNRLLIFRPKHDLTFFHDLRIDLTPQYIGYCFYYLNQLYELDINLKIDEYLNLLKKNDKHLQHPKNKENYLGNCYKQLLIKFEKDIINENENENENEKCNLFINKYEEYFNVKLDESNSFEFLLLVEDFFVYSIKLGLPHLSGIFLEERPKVVTKNYNAYALSHLNEDVELLAIIMPVENGKYLSIFKNYDTYYEKIKSNITNQINFECDIRQLFSSNKNQIVNIIKELSTSKYHFFNRPITIDTIIRFNHGI